jgi:integrase
MRVIIARRGRVVEPGGCAHTWRQARAHDGYDIWVLQAWLGHRNLQCTTRYIKLTARRFK